MPTKVLIDCDPGIDDALALLLAHAADGLDVLAITTVGGNVDLEHTTGNALKLREYLGFRDVPVAAGSAGALVRPRERAADVHGATGLGSAVLPAAALPPDPRHAVDLIIDTLAAHPGEVTLIAIGPLTNIALAVRKEPRVVEWAADIVIMGGSYTRGNHTPAAEFNIVADPEAAAIVFDAGWTVTMIGLDLTHQARAGAAVRDRMRALGRLADELIIPCLTFYTPPDGTDPAVHDVCAVACVLDPGLITREPARVDVETAGRFTTGMTVTDFRAPAPNALVATAIDAPAFWDLVLAAYSETARDLG
ncbi:MAG TPA: nucleoside hydrolase [Streptosporangiaceae bacterium]